MNFKLSGSKLVFAAVVASAVRVSIAAEPTPVLLWPAVRRSERGGRKRQTEIDAVLAPADWQPARRSSFAPAVGMVICRWITKARRLPEWLNSLGVNAFVLDYRHHGKGYDYPAPIQDAQRAIRTVRANAEKWKIDPTKIGIMGFSAGGHLASTAGTHFDRGDEKSDDPIERVGCRPDFMVLCYPVVSMTAPFTHQGSKKNLIGDHPDPELAKSLSNETQVTSDTPPTFLFHTNADTGVPVENSVMFYLAPAASKSADRNAHLSKRPTRRRPGHQRSGTHHLERSPGRLAARSEAVSQAGR